MMLWDELGLGPSILASPGGVGLRNASSAPCPQHSSILSCCGCPVSLRVSSQSPSVVSCPVVLWVGVEAALPAQAPRSPVPSPSSGLLSL